MAKVRGLRMFYKTVTKKSNRKSDDNVPRFYLLHLIVSINLVLVVMKENFNTTKTINKQGKK